VKKVVLGGCTLEYIKKHLEKHYAGAEKKSYPCLSKFLFFNGDIRNPDNISIDVFCIRLNWYTPHDDRNSIRMTFQDEDDMVNFFFKKMRMGSPPFLCKCSGIDKVENMRAIIKAFNVEEMIGVV